MGRMDEPTIFMNCEEGQFLLQKRNSVAKWRRLAMVSDIVSFNDAIGLHSCDCGRRSTQK